MAITSRPLTRAVLVCSQVPRTRLSTSGLTRANARRNVDSSAGPRAAPSPASTSGPGWAVENHGVDPDVEVTIAPHDWAAGHDPQIDAAVRLAFQALEQRPPATPPTGT